MLSSAALLLLFIGCAHSYLGERYILIRLFRRGNLPKLFGGESFTKNTLRFAWHLTTVAWWGFAALLIHLATGNVSFEVVLLIIGATFIVHGLVSVIASKGRHLSWVVFLAVGVMSMIAAG